MTRDSRARAVLAIAAVQLRRTARDRTALFFALALPVTIIVLIGSTQGGDDLDVGIADADVSPRSAELVSALGATEGFSIETYGSIDDLERDVRTGAIAAGIVVPEGYGADLGRGEEVAVELVGDVTSSATVALRASLRGAVETIGGQLAAARFTSAHTGATYEDAAAAVDDAAAAIEPTAVRTSAPDGDEAARAFGLDYTTPANLVLFVFVNTLVVGALLALERQQGLTRRMLATPHGTGTILAGVAAARLAFALGQSAIIVVVGAVVFDVQWGDPIGAAAVVVLFAIVATAVGLLVGSTVANPEQAQAIGIPIAMGMGMLGGCMWPLEIVPEAMRVVGHVTPHAWAVDAWIELVYEDAGVTDIALELGVLAALAVVLGTLAARQLRTALTA